MTKTNRIKIVLVKITFLLRLIEESKSELKIHCDINTVINPVPNTPRIGIKPLSKKLSIVE